MDEQETEQRDNEQEQDQQQNGSSDDQSDEQAKAQQVEEETQEAKKKVKELEENPPEKLEDWPDDKAKYETFGGAEGNEGYEESVTSKLGPSSLRYREDGGVEIEGEEVDDPDEYKADPIPGGPTDPRMKGVRAYGEPDLTEETSLDVESAVSEDSDAEDEDKDAEESGS